MPRSTFAAPPAQLDLPALEMATLDLWRARDIEGRSLRTTTRADGSARPAFVFYDGPPFATGLPHYGHLLAGTIKDIVPRYWFMRGYQVERRFGWDCHGLPIESLVEAELGLHGKADIEAHGVPRFNAACRAGVLRFTAEWERVVQRMGRWVDFRNDYKTMDFSFMESVWWVFGRLWDGGRIYEGYRVQPVSPALGTPLSNFEVAQGPQERDPVTRKEGHKRRQDPSLTVRFKLEDEDAWLWAWTTTPWTLPSNLALAVHPEVEYVKIRVLATGEIAYLEPGRLADYQARERVGATEELARLKGRELVGRPYAPLLPFFAQYRLRPDGSRWAFRVVAASYVSTDSGTGIVHQAPAFGEDDFQVGQAEGLPLVCPINLSGIFDARVGEFAGMFVKDADKAIVERLKREHALVDQDTIVHAYPHCYRTEQPLIYMALATWFMRVEAIRDELVANNHKIRWVPEHVGSGRFGNWLESARDWNLSRNRYWGTPLPIWRCDRDPGDMVCVRSVAELEGLAGLPAGSLTDLHRESIDGLTWPSKAGGTMRRIAEVFDCWFESGSMPYAQNHYPFDAARKQYVEDNLPADFIAEGLDQTRGWFYTLHVLSTALFGRPAFKNVIVNGLILAADGKKMSKRLKNYPDPAKVIDSYGADALRAYLINSAVVRGEPMKFGKNAQDLTGECVKETVRVAILPLWNAFNFLVTYARADGWSPTRADLSAQALDNPQDRWISSRVGGFVAELASEYETYELSNLVPAFLRVCDDLNNWYIRRGRRRYWRAKGAGSDLDKQQAYATLLRAIVTISRAMAPVLPFLAEVLHQRLVVEAGLAGPGEDSVHLCEFPRAEDFARDLALETEVELARAVVALGLTLREREHIGARRPLAAVAVVSHDPAVVLRLQGRDHADILGELNVRRIEVSSDDTALVDLAAKPNLKLLGKRLGAKLKEVAAGLQGLAQVELRAFAAGGPLTIAGEALRAEEVLLVRAPKPGLVVASEGALTVALDTVVSEDLRLEGLAREIVNRVQSLRKAADLDVSQRIGLTLRCGGALAAAASQWEELIRGETLATTLELLPGEAPRGASEDHPDPVHRAAEQLGGSVRDPTSGAWSFTDTVDDEALSITIRAREAA
ncbi:isoleucine--tRNA ligase [Nannocystis sp.]|uniref:isoleucine--tRNA ligase n=1 Tax=Nannocystis sp. TaxID=1962667 RepID=UPI0025EB13E5|nr:isoleucine--tRNA ligase [Nannocystis sp.]MBK7825175.1 isoleucine--tRNA ligase [Nannocystis sp.]